MKFGEAIKLVFEAHYEDLASSLHQDSSLNTRYTNAKLRSALAKVSAKWRPEVRREFCIMERVIRDEILLCPHNSRSTPYTGRENCVSCGAFRSLELEDNDPFSYNERKIWSKWGI